MWEEYSFSNASQRSANVDYIDDNISPFSSGAVSPLSDGTCLRSFITPCSLTELALQLERQTLQSQQPPSLLCSPRSRPDDLRSGTRRERLASPPYHHDKRRQREAMIRRQCSAANMSRLSSLVQDLLEDQSWSSDTRIPTYEGSTASLPGLGETVSLDSPTSSCMSPSTCSENGEVESRSSFLVQPKYKVGKEPKFSSSRKSKSRHYKAIRMRKAAGRVSTMSCSRCY